VEDKIQTEFEIGSILSLYNIGITAAVFYLPLLFKERGITDLQIGYLTMIYSVFLFISNTIFGKLTDIKGRRPILLTGLIFGGISIILNILPQNFEFFIILRILNGICLGITPSALIALASDKSVQMGKLSSYRALGWATGALLNGLLAEIFQLELIFVTASIIYLVGFISALKIDYNVENLSQERKIKPSYRKIIKLNWAEYLLVIMRHGSGTAIWVYWTLFLKFNLGLNNFQIGVVLAINTVTQFFLMRFISNKGNPKKQFIIGTILSGLVFFLFPFARNFIEISLMQIILGCSFAFFLVGGLRIVEERGRQNQMVGTATGLFESSMAISQIVGPIIAIIVFNKYQSFTSIMFIASLISYIGVIIYIFTSNNHN